MGRSTNRPKDAESGISCGQTGHGKCGRQRQAQPEVWFRVVHVAVDGVNGLSVATLRNQTVEIALGPNGAFESGNVGVLTRKVQSNRFVHIKPRSLHKPNIHAEPKAPRAAGTLRQAQEWRRQLDAHQVTSQAEIARRERISRARVTQILGLLHLAPEIQEQILSLTPTTTRSIVTERTLRPIALVPDHRQQLALFQALTA